MKRSQRELLKGSARRMNERAAKSQEIADKGGDKYTSAAQAQIAAGVYQKWAEQYARELLDDQ